MRALDVSLSPLKTRSINSGSIGSAGCMSGDETSAIRLRGDTAVA